MKKEVVHVPTKELAEEVLRVAQENGLMEILDIKDWEYYKTETYFRPDEYGGFANLSYAKTRGDKITPAEEFLNRYKPKFRPITMRCTREQFEAVRPKLENIGEIGELIGAFDRYNYLTNIYNNEDSQVFDFIDESVYWGNAHKNNIHHDWNEPLFLQHCGYIEEEPTELDQLRKENEELKQQLKELQDQPKVGDVCLFWDNGVNEYTLGLLREHSDDSYWSNNSYYHNCILYTDENLKKVIEQIKLNNK